MEGIVFFMVRKPRPKRQKGPLPVYDSTFKDMLKQNAREMLPVFLPRAVYEADLNVEQIRPTIRMDNAYLIKYFGVQTVLNTEYESGSDEDMVLRLRAYNAILHQDYKLPVILMIIYPFRTKMAQSPLSGVCWTATISGFSLFHVTVV